MTDCTIRWNSLGSIAASLFCRLHRRPSSGGNSQSATERWTIDSLTVGAALPESKPSESASSPIHVNERNRDVTPLESLVRKRADPKNRRTVRIVTNTSVAKGLSPTERGRLAQDPESTATPHDGQHAQNIFPEAFRAAELRSGPDATRSCQPGDQDQNQTVEQKGSDKRRGIAETKILKQELECPKCYGQVCYP